MLRFRDASNKSRAGGADAGHAGSMLAWQIDHVVREPQRNFVDRKIGVLDVLRVNDVVVTIAANQRCGSVFMHRQLPDLEFFGGDFLLVELATGDRVEQPIRFAFVGDVFRAVGKQNVPVDTVPVPVFATRELAQVAFAESCGLRHDFLFRLSDPHGGGERGHVCRRN